MRDGSILEIEAAILALSTDQCLGPAAFSMMSDFENAAYTKKIRLPILMVGAGRDETVSTPAIEELEAVCGRARIW